MSNDQRFTELWSDFLEGELSSEGMSELQELLHDPPLLAQATGEYQLHRLLGFQGQNLKELEDDFVATTMNLLPVSQGKLVCEIEERIARLEPRSLEPRNKIERTSEHRLRKGFISRYRKRWHGAVATAAVIVLLGCLGYYYQSSPQRLIEIVELHGQFEFTGDGGQIADDLTIGKIFAGGTLESLTPDAFCRLRFGDNTTVSTFGGSVLTIADDGQKKLHLRSGILSADVENQPAGRPLVVITPAARFEVLGTRFDVMADPERSKVSVREGLVRAVRLADGSAVKVAAEHSVIADLDFQSELISRRSDQAVDVWKGNLELDRKEGEGVFVSDLTTLRAEIGQAIQSGKVARDQIREVYGDRLVEVSETKGVLKAQPKQVGQSEFGRVIHVVSLDVNRGKPSPVVLHEQSLLRVRGRVAEASEIHVGIGAFGTTRASSGRFIVKRSVNQKFELEIPVSDLVRRGVRENGSSVVGMDVFAWFCFCSDANSELEISNVEIVRAE